MKDDIIVNGITEEMLAAYLDGNATKEECFAILEALPHSPQLQEILSIILAVDRDMALGFNRPEILPAEAIAASSTTGNRCCLECEKFILRKREIEFDNDEIAAVAEENSWQGDNGTALHNIGRQLERYGLSITRRFKCTIADIVAALAAGDDVIVAVDGGELIGDIDLERKEDIFIGEIPDHTVVVVSCDIDKDTITIFDPNSPHQLDRYSIEQFLDAWDDSKNYMVTSFRRGAKEYTPKPIDTKDVKLRAEISALSEAIAENAHEIWASIKRAEGWRYGPKRNDDERVMPSMVPYAELTEQEKQANRDIAMQTIKLIHKLGYDIIKYQKTQLYAELKQRINIANIETHCPRCGTALYVGQRYCDRCGEKIAKE